MNAYKGFKVGDRVSVKQPDEAYDNRGTITPDMIGTIKSFAPKVRVMKRPPLLDGLPYFAYVEFDKIAEDNGVPAFFGQRWNSKHFRGGIDICNLKKVSEIKRFQVTTTAGNTLSFFYNPGNNLVVIDLIHKNERGGNELFRQTLDEKALIGFCTKLPPPQEIETGDVELEPANG
jgi:hypothetical protein